MRLRIIYFSGEITNIIWRPRVGASFLLFVPFVNCRVTGTPRGHQDSQPAKQLRFWTRAAANPLGTPIPIKISSENRCSRRRSPATRSLARSRTGQRSPRNVLHLTKESAVSLPYHFLLSPP